MLPLLRNRDLPSCNRPVVYFRQETGYNGYRAATFLAVQRAVTNPNSTGRINIEPIRDLLGATI